MSAYDKLYESCTPKYQLILNLMAEHKLSLEQITSINLSDITSEGIKVGESVIKLSPDVFPIFVRYIASSKSKLTEGLFPGLKGNRVTPKNLMLGLRNAAKKQGIKLSELELPQLQHVSRVVNKVDLSSIQTMDDIRKFLGLVQ